MGEARELAERAITLAQSAGDQIQEAGAWHNLAESLFWSGNLMAAKAPCKKSSELLAERAPELLLSLFGFDISTISSWLAGLVELILGRPDHSVVWENRLVERAGSSPHMLSKAYGLVVVSFIASVRRDIDKAREVARIAREIGEERGFAEVLNWAIWFEGHALFWQGRRWA